MPGRVETQMAAEATQNIRIGMAAWAAGICVILAACLSMSDGRLIYTLDDPYIHLAVAETILSGGYGVNIGEPSSPSSSILYPLLLTLTELTGLGSLGPLVITLLSAGASAWITLRFLFGSVFESVSGGKAERIYPFAFALLLLFAQSAFALPFTGMEHSLHVLLAVVAFTGLIRLAETGRPPALLLVAAIIMPLVRFEGLAYSAGILLVLAWTGHWRRAAACGGAILLLFSAYAAMMTGMGLPVIPSSVSVKSPLAASSAGDSGMAAIVDALLGNLFNTVRHPAGLLLLFGLAGVLFAALRSGGWSVRRTPAWIVGAPCLIAIAGHVLAGSYGWFHRYEVYVVAILALTLTWMCRDLIREAMSRRQAAVLVASLALLSMAAAPYVIAAFQTPLAARGTHDQQYQMHRFATGFWAEPVAVNDLGYVSYRNDAYVLDLWGLGSEEVRRARSEKTFDATAIAALVRRRDVAVAMIYPQWFAGTLPAAWRRVAVMHAGTVSGAFSDVHVYATDPGRRLEVCAALARFAATTPDRVRFETIDCGE